MMRLRRVHMVVVGCGQRATTYKASSGLPGAHGTPLRYRGTVLTTNTRSDGHVIEPVLGVVLYKATNSREG